MRIDFTASTGKIKPMHAVNNGPVRDRPDSRENFAAYADAGFPYARTHDAAYGEEYGGDHIVDVHNIFPNFDADPEDPASLFAVLSTDQAMGLIADGTIAGIFEKYGEAYAKP